MAKERGDLEMRPALLEDALRDVRHGVRVLRRAPGFTVAALITLALGIGATAAIFSVVRTVMLEPLPYHQPEPHRHGVGDQPRRRATQRDRAGQLRRLARAHPHARSSRHGRPGGAGDGDQRPARRTSTACTAPSDVFRALGVQPALGRAYTAEEDFGGGDGVIVLSHEFWQRRLGGRGDVLGLDAHHRWRALGR